VLQINALKLIACIVLAHIGLIIFGIYGTIIFLLFLLYRTPRWSTTKTSIYRETQRGKILKKKKKFQQILPKFGMVGLVEEHKRVGLLLFSKNL
jgi:uncharacterized membrane protein